MIRALEFHEASPVRRRRRNLGGSSHSVRVAPEDTAGVRHLLRAGVVYCLLRPGNNWGMAALGRDVPL